jgi:hypothetical protein
MTTPIIATPVAVATVLEVVGGTIIGLLITVLVGTITFILVVY